MRPLLLVCLLISTSSTAWGAVSTIEETISTDTRFWTSAFSFATVDAAPLQDGGAGFFAYNYLSVNYRVDDDSHFAFRIPITYRSAGFDEIRDENQKQEVKIDDLLLDYTVSRTLLPGEIEMFSRGRIELPTSESSRLQKAIGSLKFDFIFSRHVAYRLETEWWSQFKWNIHTQTVYPNPDLGNSLSHTKRYEADQRVTLWYKAHPRLAVGFFVGAEDTWMNASKTNNTARQRDGRLAEHFLKLGPAARFSLNRNFNFILNISNLVPMWGFTAERQGEFNDLGRFRAEQTQFNLLSFVTF